MARTKTKTQDTTAVEISLKLGVDDGTYASNRIDMRLTRAQSRTLKRLVAGLQASGAKIQKYTKESVVNNSTDAFQFLLDEIERIDSVDS